MKFIVFLQLDAAAAAAAQPAKRRFAVKLLFHKARIIETILYPATHTQTHTCA